MFFVLVTAPEILRAQEYSQAADVYSFGLLCWSVNTQLHPFQNFPSAFGAEMLLLFYSYAQAVFKYVCDGCRPDIPADIPEPMQKLITLCWAHEPDTRPVFSDVVESLASLISTM